MRFPLPEEILLLTLDDETGRPVGRPGMAAGLALAGAVLMELALAGRIDTDRDRLERVDPAPTGDAVLDAAYAAIAEAPDSRGAILVLARQEAAMRGALLARLVAAGVLREEAGRVLWVIATRRYPKRPDGTEAEEVRARLRRVLLGNEIPDPRDALLIGLARAAGLLPLLLGPEELPLARERIVLVAGLEALSRSLATAVADVHVGRLRG